MAITGKKFSQLTDEQKVATRVPITGWLVNNLFINPLANNIEFGKLDNGDLPTNGKIKLNNDTIDPWGTIEAGQGEVGYKLYNVNWGTHQSGLSAGDGVTLLPYSITAMVNAFGVFCIEKTGADEWTISIIENGVLNSD